MNGDMSLRSKRGYFYSFCLLLFPSYQAFKPQQLPHTHKIFKSISKWTGSATCVE